MAEARCRVLDVGNCDPDHGMIRRMLERHFEVEIDRVMFVDEAIEAMRRTNYTLVLVNRLIFADSSPGIELLHRAKVDRSLAGIPIMLVSNFPEAHLASIAAGGIQGFGKASATSRQTVDRLADVLPRRNEANTRDR